MESSVDETIISNYATMIYTWIIYTILCQIINIFGIVTNVINIICFWKQGFKDSVNISLLGLSFSDLGSLLMTICSCILLSPAVVSSNLPFEPTHISYVAGWTRFSFTRVSGCITAMITAERCLCITMPLQIKSIITPKRTAATTIVIFIIFFFSATPVFAVHRFGLTFSPFKNRTLVGLISNVDRAEVETVSFAINNFFIPFSAFFIISLCTIILSVKLWKKAQWRKKTISNMQEDRVSSKNQQTAKMVVTISVLFIICFLPTSINILAIAFLPELSITGTHFNVTLLIIGLGLMLESINSSMNIFIYYYMSSKYKTIFGSIFMKTKDRNNS